MPEAKQYRVVKVIKDQKIAGWARKVDIILTNKGQTFMTEFNNNKEEIKPGLQMLTTSTPNAYNFPNSHIKG